MSNQQFSQALIYSQKILSQYQRTVFEIQQKLKNKNFSPEIIDQVIKYLKSKDYLNDQNYAISFLEFELKNRPCGRFLIYKKLIKKGIPKNLASQILDQDYPEHREIEIAQNLAEKKCKNVAWQRLSQKKKITKIGYFLKSKGFADSIIIEIIENSSH